MNELHLAKFNKFVRQQVLGLVGQEDSSSVMPESSVTRLPPGVPHPRRMTSPAESGWRGL
jgi:hypothetical protein